MIHSIILFAVQSLKFLDIFVTIIAVGTGGDETTPTTPATTTARSTWRRKLGVIYKEQRFAS